MRETTEKHFEVDEKTTPWLLLTIVFIPVWVHSLIKSEMDNSTHTCAPQNMRNKGTL